MQAIIHNGTNLVVFLRPDSDTLILDETGLRGAIRALDVTAGSHRLETVPDNPDFIGGLWRFVDGAWDIADQERYAAILADRDAAEQAAALAEAKAARAAAVAAIRVTTSAGNTFGGDEDSQNRMARALAAMIDSDTLPWVLADNTVATVTRTELQEALRQAGAAMAEIWVSPYI